ncbi:MAG: Hydroxylamine reductase [Thermodesulfobacterium sp.]|uniref:Hydroxylamine reductase n=1 Tax=Candidatus Thermodesulfobacterium syntrophicum TaxID=3060442 RepID=A0AAE3P5H5_9BACT|nr:Hydroxylamine reductase [Candidatus Thermodesulfobacterium syntrophicum]
MFCNQCEQTAKGVACTVKGVCGKSSETDVLQDLLIYTCAGLAEVALEAERKGIKKPEIDFFLMEALFSTLTNVDFDPERIKAYIEKAVELREILKKESKVDITTPWAKFEPASSMDELIKQAEEREIEPEILKEEGEDIASLTLTRNYYTEFVEKVPQDCIVLTLGCGKFRFFDKDLGTIEGISQTA